MILKKPKEFIPLFQEFIKASETGYRLKKNGEKLKQQSIDNYKYTLKNLILYESSIGQRFRVVDVSRAKSKRYFKEMEYWKDFYSGFKHFLYSRGCHDNYVGLNIKNFRTFFSYLETERNLSIGNIRKIFFVQKESIQVLVLKPNQLKFLINDKEFEKVLSPSLKRSKDMFVFGCATGLRFSDLIGLTKNNFEDVGSETYLSVKSKKTGANSFIKLPSYAVEILKRFSENQKNDLLFPSISLFNFNKNLKKIGKLAGFCAPISTTRNIDGIPVQHKEFFYQKMSSHMMRRTAITTYLTFGMPEHLVRHISGHEPGSKSFSKYIHYTQSYLNKEIDKIHAQFS